MTGDKRRTEGRREQERGMEGDICRTKKKWGGDERSEDGSLCSFTSALVPNNHRDC